MLNSLDLERPSAGHPRRRRHVRRRRFVGDRGAAQGRGLRRRRRHAAALRPRRGDPPQGRLLRRPGHPRRARVAERIGIPHYVLDYESRFKEAVIDRFAESYVAGETPVPCVDCNMAIKFHDLLDDGARARRQGAGDRPLRRIARAAGRRPRAATAPARRSATRATSCSPPRASSSTCCAFRSATAARPRRARWRARFGLAVADKHDSQDICFVPTGRYADVIERLKPGAAEAGDIVDLDGKVLGRHDGIIHFTVGQRRGLEGRDRRAALCGAARCRDAPRRGRPARGADHAPHPAARRQLDRRGRARSLRSTAAGSRCSSRCARRGRRSRRGWRAAPTACEVELVDGEDGVSPGPGLRVLRRGRRARRGCSAAASSAQRLAKARAA